MKYMKLITLFLTDLVLLLFKFYHLITILNEIVLIIAVVWIIFIKG